MKDKLLSMIGLARRAAKISSGSFGSEQAIKGGFAKLVIISEDASENTKKNIENSCKHYRVPYIEYSDMEALGKCVGEDSRSVISVNDNNFASAISDIYNLSIQGM